MAFSGQTVTSLGRRKAVVDVEGHEEADTKLVPHIIDALQAGHRSIVVTTVDTDVVVILIGIHQSIIEQYPDADIWVGFGPKKYFRYYHINTLHEDWGTSKARAMPFFHALTGSDTTSQFCRHGKRAAWNTWTAFHEATEAFLISADQPFIAVDESSHLCKIVERFICLLYESSTELTSVNDQRRELFTKKGKQMEALPPSQACRIFSKVYV